MPRHPHDIVPRDDKDEVLVAIYDVLVEIRDALAPPHSPEEEPVPAENPPAETKSQVKRKTAQKPAAKKAPARKKPA